MRLFLFRHGETDYNRDGLTLGREDTPLNDLGRQQAEAIAAAYAGESFAAIYASPLQRARDTAAPVARRLGLPVAIEPDLTEMDVGELGSLTGRELREKHGAFLDDWLGPDVADVRMPAGETLREVQARAWAVLERLASRHGEDRIAVFTHNFVVLAVLCRALSLDLSGFRRLRQDLAAVSLLTITAETSRLDRMNDGCHLAELASAPRRDRG